jgi:hypothetical protein
MCKSKEKAASTNMGRSSEASVWNAFIAYRVRIAMGLLIEALTGGFGCLDPAKH